MSLEYTTKMLADKGINVTINNAADGNVVMLEGNVGSVIIQRNSSAVVVSSGYTNNMVMVNGVGFHRMREHVDVTRQIVETFVFLFLSGE